MAQTLLGRLFDWTGFRGKTAWDWLKLLIVPIALSAAGFWVQLAVNSSTQAVEAARAQETVLQAYLDRMTALLLEKELGSSKQNDPLRYVARARTMTVLRQLNSTNKGLVMQFLYDTELILHAGAIDIAFPGPEEEGVTYPVIPLGKADLTKAKLSGAWLPGAYLYEADLRGADLTGAWLQRGANLRRADLSGASLKDTNLGGSHLAEARLVNADLRGASLWNADLGGADLTGADVTEQQLAAALTLVGATMPDGSEMTEARWKSFTTQHSNKNKSLGNQ